MHFLKEPKALIPCKLGVLAESSFLCYTNKTMNLHRNSERERERVTEKFKDIKWDIKKGYAAYRSISTDMLCKWIKEGKINNGEVKVWRSGLSGFRRPEDLDELKPYFSKKTNKKSSIAPPRKSRKD